MKPKASRTAKRLPSGPLVTNVEFDKSLQKLVSRLTKQGLPVPNGALMRLVPPFVEACSSPGLQEIMKGPFSSQNRKSRIEVVADIFWKFPDFTIQMMQLVHANEKKRDALDKVLATVDLATTSDPEVQRLAWERFRKRYDDEAVKKRRSRTTEKANAFWDRLRREPGQDF